jgi:signal transduction histidine kinase/ligand-binding sensor domain-containing protein
MNCGKIGILFLIISIQINISQAQIKFKHIGAADGLLQSHILCMTQDSEGFVWIGTYGGLHRYNAYEMESFTHQSSDGKSLSHNVVYCVFEDLDKNIWIGTESGLNCFDRKSKTFTRYYNDQGDDQSLSFNHIRSINQQDSGCLWIGTYGGGLNRFDLASRTFSHYKHNKDDSGSIVSDFVNVLYVDNKKNLWIGTEHGGLSEYVKENDTFINYVPNESNPNSINNDIVSSIVQDKKGIFWIGTWRGGLNRFDPITETFNHYSDDTKTHSFLPHSAVRDLLVDSNDEIWIATFGNGLATLDKNREKFSVQTFDFDDPKSIKQDVLWSIMQDREGQIWCGTFGGGISIYDAQKDKFNSSVNTRGCLFTSYIIQDIYEENSDILWFATNNGIDIYDKNSRKCIHFLLLNEGSEIKDVKKIFKDRSGRYWIGTNAGLIRMNKDLNGFQKVVMENAVYDILQDEEGNIWASGWNTGLIYIPNEELTKTNLNYKLYKHSNSSSLSESANTIWSIFIDSNNIFWVANQISTEIFDRNTGSFSRTGVDEVGSCFQIIQDSKQNIWFATTTKGLVSYNQSTKKYTNYSTKEGLANNITLFALEDDNGNIWVATNDGISCVNPESKEIRNYTVNDGLPDSKFLLGSHQKLFNGDIVVGSGLGFVEFNPDEISGNQIQPNIVFTDFKLFGKSISLETEGNATPVFINKSLSSTDTLIFKHDQNMLTMEFAALSFSSPSENMYKYKLEGFDENWIESGNYRKATYTNLDPGEYTFKVKASNNDGVWNDNPIFITIIIKPPFWLTWWFKIFILLLIVSGVTAIYYLKLHQIEQRNKELEIIVSKRTKELFKANAILLSKQNQILEQNNALAESEKGLLELNLTKDKFFSIISHDLKAPFNAILGFSEELTKNYDRFDSEMKKELITYIHEGAINAFKLLENLLLWARSQRGTITFLPSKTDLYLLTNEIVGGLSSSAIKKMIHIKIEVPDPMFVEVDCDMLSTIIRNLLSNAIKFTPQNGLITISIENKKQFVEIVVKDSGVGISKEKQNALFDISKNQSTPGTDDETGTGLGLILCKEFTEKHGGKIWVESEVGKGSSFCLTIPIGAEN